MKIGQIIKIERQRKNVKQDELASGICSSSYLSKIERGTAIPGDEIQQMLLQRLNIPLEKGQQHTSPNILVQFKKRFGNIVNSRDKQAAHSLCEEIHSFLVENKHSPHTTSLLLIETRLMLMTSSDIKENLSVLLSLQNELSSIQRFHMYIIQGGVAYNENRFSDALTLFKNAYSLTTEHRMENWEVAELHYMISLAAICEYQHILAIEHIQKALAYFNRKVLIIRSIDCLLILGNAQKYTKNISGALISFENAKRIMTTNEHSQRLGMIEHNLGVCHSLLKDHERALHHFTQSLLLKTQDDGKIFTIFALLKEHKKIGNIEQAKVFVKKGLSVLDSLSEPNKLLFGHHFAIYHALLYDDDNLIAIFEPALDYFKQKQSDYYCFIYCHVLAAKLTEKSQFKLATTYYQKAFNYHLNHHDVQHWEELT